MTVVFDPRTAVVTWGGGRIQLRRGDAALLEVLATANGTAWTADLRRALWGSHLPGPDALRMRIHLLRKRLAAIPVRIDHQSGEGWVLGTEVRIVRGASRTIEGDNLKIIAHLLATHPNASLAARVLPALVEGR